MANLRSDAALKHGARSEEGIRELTRTLEAELGRVYPGESDVWLKLQARRLAKITKLGAYLESRPSEVLNQRTGKLNPAAAEEEALTRALLADFERAQQRKREPGAGLAALRQIGAEMGDSGGS